MFRIGHGYDVHRFVDNRRCIIGGVQIPFELGLLGHSDADVLIHAVIDALFGAAALGDIGQHFPDTDAALKDVDSIYLLQETMKIIRGKEYQLENIDATVVAQQPKLGPYIPKMRQRIANACEVSLDQINVKATTEEGLGFTGTMAGAAAHAVCLLSGK